MINQVIRMVAAAAGDAEQGVAYQLAVMEMDEDDNRPKTPTIIATSNDGRAVYPASADAKAAMDWPLLIITSEVPSRITATGVLGKGFDIPNLMVMMLYLTGEKMDPEIAWRDCDYTLQATIQALLFKLFAPNVPTARVRGKVQILKQNSMEYSPADAKVKSGRVVGLLNLDLHIRVNP